VCVGGCLTICQQILVSFFSLNRQMQLITAIEIIDKLVMTANWKTQKHINFQYTDTSASLMKLKSISLC